MNCEWVPSGRNVQKGVFADAAKGMEPAPAVPFSSGRHSLTRTEQLAADRAIVLDASHMSRDERSRRLERLLNHLHGQSPLRWERSALSLV